MAVTILHKCQWYACKSNLKILEAASKKIPCIVSDVEPYNVDEDCPVLFVKNQSDWFKYIKFLTLNKQARIDYGEKLYEWAKEKYNFTTANPYTFTHFFMSFPFCRCTNNAARTYVTIFFNYHIKVNYCCWMYVSHFRIVYIG